MPALPAWKNFTTERDPSTPIDAVSPYDAPLNQFQVGHTIEWEFMTTGGGALGMMVGMGIEAGQAVGVFEFKLMEGATVSFWQRVELTFTWTALSFGGFAGGGLDLFTWAFTKEKIDTYVIDSAPTDKHPTSPDPNNPAWRYTIGGAATSEFGIAIPGGGPESGNGVGIMGGQISSFWQGPLYQNARIAGKAGLDIIRDRANVSAPLARLPLWHIRAVEGADEIDAYFMSLQPLAKAFARSGRVYYSLATLPGTDQERGVVGDGAEPSIGEDLAGIQFAHILAPDQKVYEFHSYDTGHTWRRRRKRKDATTTDEVDVVVWEQGYNMPRMVPLEDGHRGTVTYKNGALWFSTSRDNFQGAILVANVKNQDAYELSVDDAGVYFVSSAGRQEFYSDQGGQVWKPVVRPNQEG